MIMNTSISSKKIDADMEFINKSKQKGYSPYLSFFDDIGAFKIDYIKALKIEIKLPEVKKVIFNDPATIIYWADGSKTVVKCQKGDTYNKEVGFMAAYMKKVCGNGNEFNKIVNKWVWGGK